MTGGAVMLRTLASMRLRRLDDRGASLVEYALLLALIALVCLTALSFLGGNVATEYNDAGVSVANAN